jgi:hypothetical protein
LIGPAERRIRGRMIRFFDLADRDRLPQRFAAAARSVLARG